MRHLFFPGLILLIINSGCSTTKNYHDPVPEYLSFTLQSTKVAELRTINVWYPMEVLADSDSLPVLYMPDGGIKEDFPHIANTLAKLIKSGRIPPTLLVGIENTKRRKDLTGPTEVATDKEIAPEVGGSFAFRDFIKEELIPEVNRRFHPASKKGIIGESLAGLFVIETFLLQPGLFDYYIAFDPSLWWNNYYLEQHAKIYLDNFSGEHKTLWFAGSGTRGVMESTGKLANTLTAENIPGLQWHYAEEPDEKHSTIFRATKKKALIWAIGKN